MILYLLVCVFFMLLTLIALGLVIGGIIKGKRMLWIGSLSAFVVLVLVSVFSVYLYISKSIDYMGSEEFQEQTRKSASNWGKNIGNTVSGAAEGIESTLDEEAISKLAEKSGFILGNGVQAISRGVDDAVGKQKVFLDKKVEELGVSMGRAEWLADSSKMTFSVYLEFERAFKGTLSLVAYDREGNKVDRSRKILEHPQRAEGVIVFTFDYLQPAQSEYCILSLSDI
jgi:hypothetical protein